jgi:fibronectin type III domain protein
MKPLAFVILGLVASLILTNLPATSYGDPQLDSLVRIASQARDNIHIQLSQLSTIPDEINQLYQQGSDETDALAQSVSKADEDSSKTHFLSAMKIFKTINDDLSSLTSTNEQQPKIDTLPLIGEINRMQKLGDKLKSISQDNNVEIDFSKFDELMKDARQGLVAGNVDQVKQDLKTANQFLLESRHILADAANKKTTDRAKEFTNKQIERLSADVPLQNYTQPIVPTENPLPEATNSSQIENIPDMIAKLKQLVSDGNVDEALKILKLINTLQIEKNAQVSSTESLNSTQPTNENNLPTPEISNQINNSTNTQTPTKSSVTPTIPKPPTGLKATAISSSEIDLSWNAPTDNGGSAITGYSVLRSRDGGSTWNFVTSNTGSTATTFAHTGISAGSTYTYSVHAINSIGTSYASNIASATTLTKTTTSTQISLNVKSVGLDGLPIPGLSTTVKIGTTTVQTGYTPLSYVATSGKTYTITVSNYQNYVFDHWKDGSKNRSISITLTKETTLTAYYKISIPNQENPANNAKSSSDNLSHNEITKRLQENENQ